MLWWWWVILGFALLALEILTPGGFFALFFGIAAVTVGVLATLDVVTAPWAQWALFSALSLVALALVRRPLQQMMQPPAGAEIDRITSEIATLLEDVVPGGIGKAELRGTSWSVRNDDRRNLQRGERVHVVKVDGLTLWVRAQAPEGGKQ